jgi:uncharacterized protein (TIGR00159 family)
MNPGTAVRIVDFFDIFIISVVLYFCILWLRERSSRIAFAGITLVAALYVAARTFNMYLTSFLFQAGFAALLVALVVVFQLDIRRAFERLALRNIFQFSRTATPIEQTVGTIVDSMFALAANSVGALVVIKGRESIDMHIRAGTELDGLVSTTLIRNIFSPRAPGHDGAMLVEGNRVKGFGFYLPLSMKSTRIGQTGGTRHAAAMGLAERSDSLVIVVSEERGKVSVAMHGELIRIESPDELRRRLTDFYAAHTPALRTSLRRLTSNPGTKTAAVVLSSALWLLFARQAETVSRGFDVPVEVRDIPSGWIIKSVDPSVVRVTLSGRERAFTDASDNFMVSLRPDTLAEGMQRLTISDQHIVRSEGLSVDNISPAAVKVAAYRTVERRLPVHVTLSGRPTAGRRIARASPQPDSVTVLLAASIEKPPERCTTEPVDLESVTADTVVRVRLRPIQDAQFVNLQQAQVRVSIEFEKRGK